MYEYSLTHIIMQFVCNINIALSKIKCGSILQASYNWEPLNLEEKKRRRDERMDVNSKRDLHQSAHVLPTNTSICLYKGI